MLLLGVLGALRERDVSHAIGHRVAVSGRLKALTPDFSETTVSWSAFGSRIPINHVKRESTVQGRGEKI
jgi:hypothetical protein